MEFLFGSSEYKPSPLAPEYRMPDEVKNYIVERCFDACIGEFTDKRLLKTESHCMEECATNLKKLPLAYQQTQQFQGFIKREVPKIFKSQQA